MKPLPSAPLTREDKLIWLGINVPLNKKHFGYHYSKAYFASDRRDAELMFKAQDRPEVGLVWVPFDLEGVTSGRPIDVRCTAASIWLARHT